VVWEGCRCRYIRIGYPRHTYLGSKCIAEGKKYSVSVRDSSKSEFEVYYLPTKEINLSMCFLKFTANIFARNRISLFRIFPLIQHSIF
jgi:hypothetical protein